MNYTHFKRKIQWMKNLFHLLGTKNITNTAHFYGNLLIEWKRRTKAWKRNKCYTSFWCDSQMQCSSRRGRKKQQRVYMKKQFGSQHTWRAWNKAQSHQVEFNWLQLFNSFFRVAFVVRFVCTRYSIGLSVYLCVCAHFAICFSTSLEYFSLKIPVENSVISQTINAKKNTKKKQREKKKHEENLSISTATVPQIYQFQGMCIGNMCLSEKSEPTHLKQTTETKNSRTIMEQVNGGSSNTEKIHLFFVSIFLEEEFPLLFSSCFLFSRFVSLSIYLSLSVAVYCHLELLVFLFHHL